MPEHQNAVAAYPFNQFNHQIPCVCGGTAILTQPLPAGVLAAAPSERIFECRRCGKSVNFSERSADRDVA